jgi:site-specific recombinase XerD
MSKPSNFLKLLDDFINNYLPFSVGLSLNTVTSYKYAFRLLIEFMFAKKGIPADKIIFAHLDYNTLLEFFNWIEKDRGCSIATKNQRLSAILSFSAYAQNRDLLAASIFRTSVLKIPMKKGHGKPRAVFTTQEISILLRLPNEHSEIGIRNKVLLSLMYASGARAQEICNLTVVDIEFLSKGTRLKLNGKGGKARRIGIPDNCGKILQKYITHRRIANKPDRHVFSSQTHEKMTISCIEGIFNKYVTQAKNENPVLFKESSYPPHSMRHATGSHMLEAGVPIVVIKNFLGHKSIQSTQIYAELTQNTIEKHLKEWNDKWFSHNSGELKATEPYDKKIPDFLSIK